MCLLFLLVPMSMTTTNMLMAYHLHNCSDLSFLRGLQCPRESLGISKMLNGLKFRLSVWHLQKCNELTSIMTAESLYAAHLDETLLSKSLSDQALHLESALFLANAQLAVAKLEKSSYQSAYEEAARQLSFTEAEVGLMQTRLTAKQSELEVRLVWLQCVHAGGRVYASRVD